MMDRMSGEERRREERRGEEKVTHKKGGKAEKGTKRKDLEEGSMCVYHAGVCQQGQRAKHSFASVHFY